MKIIRRIERVSYRLGLRVRETILLLIVMIGSSAIVAIAIYRAIAAGGLANAHR